LNNKCADLQRACDYPWCNATRRAISKRCGSRGVTGETTFGLKLGSSGSDKKTNKLCDLIDALGKEDAIQAEAREQDFPSEAVVLSVERMDYTKGILHRLEAIDYFLAGRGSLNLEYPGAKAISLKFGRTMMKMAW
jgi:hypothetical protein